MCHPLFNKILNGMWDMFLCYFLFYLCLGNCLRAHLDSRGFDSYSKWTNVTLRSRRLIRSRSISKSRFNLSLIDPNPQREIETFDSLSKTREIVNNSLVSKKNLDISHKSMRFSSILRSRKRMLGKKTTKYLRRYRRFSDNRMYINGHGTTDTSMS